MFQSKNLETGEEVSLDDFFGMIPFMETEWKDGQTGAEKFIKLDPPRFMKTHLPYELWKPQLEKHPNLRVIQTLRNPKDTFLSYYHHMRNMSMLGAFSGTWLNFLKLFERSICPGEISLNKMQTGTNLTMEGEFSNFEL